MVYPPPTAPIPNLAGALAGGPGENNGVVTQKLFEIASRLQSIESALHVRSGPDYLHDSPQHASSRSASQVARSLSPGSSDDGMDHDGDEGPERPETNPIHIINQTLHDVVGVAGKSPVTPLDYGAPDVVKRGVLTTSECQELFEFFFASIHPWVMMLSLDEDRDAAAVRKRSTLLFHTILLLATSYSVPFPSQLHVTLTTFVNSILAPQILSPQPHELNTDFLRAIDLLNLYKPVQLASRRAEGKSDADAMRMSKVNGLASWMLQGILARTAECIDLASVLHKFSRAYSASSTGAEIPKSLLRDLRLYYWLLSNDVHGNVQSGRRCNMEAGAALTTTRLFSSLQMQPYDTRLAASVEMFEVARPILRSTSYERSRRIPRADLERFNTGMKVWEEFWCPILLQQLAVDPLAMSVCQPFSWFITLTYNASTYVSWKQNRMYSSDSGGDADVKPPATRDMRLGGARGLTDWEFAGLERCIEAAEALIFTLSEESRVRGGWRVVNWAEAERSDGWRKLILDQSMVELSRWGMDAITCISYVYPLVFLSHLVTDGVLTADLVLIRTPSTQPPWLITQKLPRLLELGASFLDAIAFSNEHPARGQAHLLRSLLDAGIKGTPASPPVPSPAQPSSSSSDYPLPAPIPSSSSSALLSHNGVAQPQPIYASQMAAGPSSQQWLGNAPPPPNAALLQFQQQTRQQPQQQQQQARPQHQRQISMTPMEGQMSTGASSSTSATGSQSGAGMDMALAEALDGFDPLFGTSAFWEWGGNSIGNDWGTIPSDLSGPGP
ncbi:hypothetical protein RQP46_001119 [Phenoliferia psychrophenolica]